jgi:hypothetical protein
VDITDRLVQPASGVSREAVPRNRRRKVVELTGVLDQIGEDVFRQLRPSTLGATQDDAYDLPWSI